MSQKNKKIDLLDHGFVRFIDSMGSDLAVSRSARISYDAEWRAGEDEGKDAKLINYLLKNAHTSPFESVTFTFEVKAPIFVVRQWHRHRTMSYSEQSARYSVLPEEFYVPKPEQITQQSLKNKQQRTDVPIDQAVEAANLIEASCKLAFDHYRQLMDMGVPRELARGVLPMNTYTHMFVTVNLLNLFRFLKLRDHSHAQYEIQVYAQAMLELIEPIVPVCVAAFRQYWQEKEPTPAIISEGKQNGI